VARGDARGPSSRGPQGAPSAGAGSRVVGVGHLGRQGAVWRGHGGKESGPAHPGGAQPGGGSGWANLPTCWPASSFGRQGRHLWTVGRGDRRQLLGRRGQTPGLFPAAWPGSRERGRGWRARRRPRVVVDNEGDRILRREGGGQVVVAEWGLYRRAARSAPRLQAPTAVRWPVGDLPERPTVGNGGRGESHAPLGGKPGRGRPGPSRGPWPFQPDGQKKEWRRRAGDRGAIRALWENPATGARRVEPAGAPGGPAPVTAWAFRPDGLGAWPGGPGTARVSRSFWLGGHRRQGDDHGGPSGRGPAGVDYDPRRPHPGTGRRRRRPWYGCGDASDGRGVRGPWPANAGRSGRSSPSAPAAGPGFAVGGRGDETVKSGTFSRA